MGVADALLVVAWGVFVADLAWQARRVSHAPVRARAWAPSPAVRIAVVVALLGGGWTLERAAGGAWPVPVWVRALGVAVATGGVVLHARARRVLGRHWSATVLLRDDQALVTDGPYARVRHPLYLGVLLLAGGTLLGHPSLATASVALGLAIGVALKIRREDRALRDAFGDAWRRWARDVPALLPRLRS